MKKKIRLLVVCLVLVSAMWGVRNPAFAEVPETESASVSLRAQQKPDSLYEVYVSDSGTPDGSGTDEEHPISDFSKALSLIKKGGVITVVDQITTHDTEFPDKSVTIIGRNGDTESQIVFTGTVEFDNFIYIQNLTLSFAGAEKDCVFVNGGRLELTNASILGNPNIYLGARDRDLAYDEKGALIISNPRLLPTEINNIYLAGYNGHTAEISSVELGNVRIGGKIDGENLLDRGYFTASGQTVVPVITNVPKVFLNDNANLYITGRMDRVLELYGDKAQITLNETAPVQVTYVYGDMAIGLSGKGRTEETVLTCSNMVGELMLTEELAQEGYRLNRVRSGNRLVFTLADPMAGEQETNYAPNILCSPNVVMREGTVRDIRAGVTAWDHEDGDITASIVFPDVELSRLPVGVHEIVFEVTDSQGNVTKTTQTIYVIANAFPVFSGVDDVEIPVGDVESFDLLHGIAVRDDKDGNLEIQVAGQLGKPAPGTTDRYVISYRVEDSDKHVTQAERTITVTNYIPEIKGLDPVKIDKDQAFDWMAGVTASDYEDGVVTNITMQQEIDLTKPGTYELVYCAVDSDGNMVEAIRKVTITASVDWSEIGPSFPITPTPPTPSPDPEEKPDVKPEPQPEEKPDVKPEPQPEEKPDVKPEPQPEEKPDVKPEPQPGEKPDVKPEPQPDKKPDTQAMPKPGYAPVSSQNQEAVQTAQPAEKLTPAEKSNAEPEADQQTAPTSAKTEPTMAQQDNSAEKPVNGKSENTPEKKNYLWIPALVVIAVIAIAVAYRKVK